MTVAMIVISNNYHRYTHWDSINIKEKWEYDSLFVKNQPGKKSLDNISYR